MPTFGLTLLPVYDPSQFGALCRQVDGEGAFDTLWISDERFFRDMGVQLTLASLNTRRVRIGVGVTDPFVRHPALTATAMATVDELSAGRLHIGFAAGESGLKAMGVAQVQRLSAIREAITLMRSLWSGQQVDFLGSTISFKGSLDFSPYRSRIPIWVAGRGPRLLALAGEIADGVIIGALASEAGISYALNRVDAGLRVAHRSSTDFTKSLWVHVAVADDPERARSAVRNMVLGALLSSRQVLHKIGIAIPPTLLDATSNITYGINNPEMQRASEMVDEEVLRHFSVAGTNDEVASRLAELARMPVDHIAIVPWLCEGQTVGQFIQHIGSMVGPLVAAPSVDH